MSVPCPQDYSCTFTLTHPRTIVTHDLWWHGPWGIVVALVAILALAAIIGLTIYWIMETRRDTQLRQQQYRQIQDQQAHTLAMEEQRTMQADAAKGNPEMLKLIRQKI
jgi:uncharacterized protein HemX